MAEASERMVKFLEVMKCRKARGKPVRPILRAKSYILQEAEAAVRSAKVEWCEMVGVQVLGLQHDGIWVSRQEGRGGEEAAKMMSEFVSKKCGYEVVIKKEHGEEGTVTRVWEEVRSRAPHEREWNLPPLRAIREEGTGSVSYEKE
jgi:hypothetical protein